MTYASLLEAYGWERFEADAARRRRDELHHRRHRRGLTAGAEARPARRPHLDRRARSRSPRRETDGWLYLVTLTGTTGARTELSDALGGLAARARAHHRRAALRRLRDLDAGAGTRGGRPRRTAIVVGSRAVLVAEEGPAALAGVRGVAARAAHRRLTRWPAYFGWTRSPQRSQRWNRSVRKNHFAFGTLWPKILQRRSHASGPILTSIFPMFSPLSSPSSASGACSRPSTTVSR